MSIWLFRAGSKGEYEEKFLTENRIYLTWNNLDIDLSDYANREKLYDKLCEIYPTEKSKTLYNWLSQIYPIAHRMQKDDWVVLPSKRTSTIHFGKIVGDYEFNSQSDNPYYHSRKIEWFAQDIPRSNFDQDLLYSFGAFMTVCKITRNDAENRIKTMAENNWHTSNTTPALFSDDDIYSEINTNLEEAIYDAISKYILRKFQGYKMEDLIEEILKAKGFTVYHSKRGADGGKDLLASGGEMGFGSPKICVQVKTQDSAVDRPTLDQLGGVMNNVNAEYGLLVSWNGFKDSVAREEAKQFFRIRLWDSNDVIKELFENYEKLSPSIRAEIPLKQIWMLSEEE